MELLYPDNYVAFDFETTGLNPKTDKIVEIGALRVVNGKVTEAFHEYLDHDIDVPIEASNVHGLTREKLKKEGNFPETAMESFIDFLMLEEGRNLTHNGFKFDIPFLFNAVTPEQLERIKRPISKGCIDTAVMYKARAIQAPRLWNQNFTDWAASVMEVRAYGVKFNVAHCCKELGISTEGKNLHNALTDIQLTHEIYQALTAQNALY